MREKFRQQLEEMYHQMVVMGGLCQQAIAVAVKTLEEEEDTAENLEAQVFALDGEIDDMEREIEACAPSSSSGSSRWPRICGGSPLP